MNDNENLEKDPFFQEVEDRVIEAEEKFIGFVNHPVFSLIEPAERQRIENLIRTIQVVAKDELLQTMMGRNYDKLKPQQKERKLEGMDKFFTYYIPEKDGEESRILVNYEAFERNPQELPYIFENIAKMIAHDLGQKTGLIELNKFKTADQIKNSDLSEETKVHLPKKIAHMLKNENNLKDFWLRTIGFQTETVNKKTNSFDVISYRLEDIRSDLIRTIMEGIMYAPDDVEFGTFKQVVEGFNAMELKVLKDRKLESIYIREHLNIVFLTKYLLNFDIPELGSKANIVGYKEEMDEELLSKLKLLVKSLTTLDANSFLAELMANPVPFEAFKSMMKKYGDIFWSQGF
jgi:hypothetical protein